MKSERLFAGDPCLAKLPGLRAPWFKAQVVEVLPKGYRVKPDADAADLDPVRVKETCCKRVTAPRKSSPTPFEQKLKTIMVDSARIDGVRISNNSTRPAMITVIGSGAVSAQPYSQPKPAQPWRSEAYKAIVRAQRCCNCGQNPPSDPDHYGKRGTGQKCSDALTTGLCRKCHTFRTGVVGHIASLPDPLDSARKGKPVLRSPEETADILAKEQVRLMSLVLELLPLGERVDALRRAVEGIPEERLREITKRSARSE